MHLCIGVFQNFVNHRDVDKLVERILFVFNRMSSLSGASVYFDNVNSSSFSRNTPAPFGLTPLC